MSNILSTLKVKFSADTSEFKKGTEEGKKAIQDMTSEAGSSMASFAQLFGVNIGAMSSQIKGFQTTVSGMSAGFSNAAKGSTLLSKAMGVLKVALISTGIGALLVAIGALVASFTTTGEGADKLNQIMESIGAVFRVITGEAAKLGKAIISAFKNPKETISDLWEFIKSNFVNRITAIPQLIQAAWNIVKSIFTDASMADAAADMASTLTQLGTGLDKTQQKNVLGYFKKVGTEMGTEAKEAYRLQGALEDLEDQERKLGVVASERERQIKALRLLSTDETKDAKDRLAANKQAMALELANVNDQKKLQKELVNIHKQKLALIGDDAKDEELDVLAEAQRRLNEVESESLVTQKKLQSEYNNLSEAITKQAEAVIAARKKQDEYLTEIRPETKAVTPKLADGTKLRTQLFVDVVPTVDYGTIVPNTKKVFVQIAETIKTNLAIAQTGLDEFAYTSQMALIDMSAAIEKALESSAVGFGELVGNMMAGTGSISDLGSLVLGNLADLLITVGTMAIQAGIAVDAIVTSLSTLGGAGAIIAGIALVALGTAVKSGLKSAASGGRGGMSTVASPVTSIDTRNSSSAASAQTAAVQVEVTGEFKQRGADLVAVVSKENNRKTLTT